MKEITNEQIMESLNKGKFFECMDYKGNKVRICACNRGYYFGTYETNAGFIAGNWQLNELKPLPKTKDFGTIYLNVHTHHAVMYRNESDAKKYALKNCLLKAFPVHIGEQEIEA